MRKRGGRVEGGAGLRVLVWFCLDARVRDLNSWALLIVNRNE